MMRAVPPKTHINKNDKSDPSGRTSVRPKPVPNPDKAFSIGINEWLELVAKQNNNICTDETKGNCSVVIH